MILSNLSMRFLRTIGAVVAGAVLCAPMGWCLPAGQTTLFQPTAKQMQSIQKMLGGKTAAAAKAAKPKALLPARFGDWTRGIVSSVSLQAANSAALKEFGLEQGKQTKYSHDGETVAVQVWQFPDATGAYGAFTMLRSGGMKTLRIGPRIVTAKLAVKGAKKAKAQKALPLPLTYFNGAQDAEHFLFWKGSLLVDATFAQPVADEVAVLTRLAAGLPGTMGSRGTPPSLPEQLPLDGLERGSVRYAIGPAGYARENGVLPAEVVNFGTDAEVVTAQYGKGTLTVISYPTPEIALAREAAVASVLKSGVVPGAMDALRVKRAGPLVALTSGKFTQAEADTLLKDVKFQGTVAMDRVKPQESEVAKTAKLLVGIASLTVILGLASILLGFFLGGGRAMYRVMRGKPASTLADEEFISLELNKPENPPVSNLEGPR